MRFYVLFKICLASSCSTCFQRTVSFTQCQLWASSSHIQDYQCLVEFDLHWEADGVASPTWLMLQSWFWFLFLSRSCRHHLHTTQGTWKFLTHPVHPSSTLKKCETIRYFFQTNFVYFCIPLCIACTKYVYALPFPMYSCHDALGYFPKTFNRVSRLVW